LQSFCRLHLLYKLRFGRPSEVEDRFPSDAAGSDLSPAVARRRKQVSIQLLAPSGNRLMLRASPRDRSIKTIFKLQDKPTMKKSIFGFAAAMLLTCTLAFAGNNNAETAKAGSCCSKSQSCACAEAANCKDKGCTNCTAGECSCETACCQAEDQCCTAGREEAGCCSGSAECICD
jgi:hypothetical protein